MRFSVTMLIITLCFAIFIAQNIIPGFTETFALIPAFALSGQAWQFVTYMFLHGSIGHLIINMFILFMFGVVIERAVGAKWFVIFFIVSGIGSALFHLLLSGQSLVIMLGASGSIFGILAAFAFMFPDMRLFVFPLPVPVKAIYAVIGIAAFELIIGLTGIMPEIANFGHLGGLVTGVLLTASWKYYKKHKLKRRSNQMRDFEFYWE